MGDPVSVHDRSVWIIDYLRRTTEPAQRTIRAIWEAARASADDQENSGLSDLASLPTYHRTLGKLLRHGQVTEVGETADGSAVFLAAEQLSPLSTYTLTDLNAAMWEMSAPEAMALYLDAVDYFESHANQVLGQAAKLLMTEDPRKLIVEMLKDRAAEIQGDVEILNDPHAFDPSHRANLEINLRDLRHFVCGELGIGGVWNVPNLHRLNQEPFESPDWKAVEQAIDKGVFGATFLAITTAQPPAQDQQELIVAGTDGSAHAGYVRGVPAPRYVEEEGHLQLTFNNSIAYVQLPKGYPHSVPSPYHGVPMTRTALEDPHNRGMIISKPWFPDLEDSEFEHMKKSALDVVQFRVDERLATGVARAYGSAVAGGNSGSLPKPNLLLRDGTVTPQEREFQHYCRQNAYGDFSREGITLSYNILRSVMDSNRRIFAGAVKMTQLRTFARIVNWYIKRRVNPAWDIARASQVSDSVMMTKLINALPPIENGADYYKTCVIVRPFTALSTELRSFKFSTSDEWLQYFKGRQEQQTETYQTHGAEPSWFVGQDVEDDPYVRMCQLADYAMFYFGKPGGEPQITFPRFEFLDALRRLDPQDRDRRVANSVELIIDGVHHTKWTLDREHNFMSQRRMPRLVPYVIYQAHEKCKALGHKLEAELRQAIAMRLSQLKASRGLNAAKVDFDPVPIRRYLEVASKRWRGLLSDDSEPGEDQ